MGESFSSNLQMIQALISVAPCILHMALFLNAGFNQIPFQLLLASLLKVSNRLERAFLV